MNKTYAVHYGTGHLINSKTVEDEFDNLEDAMEEARALVAEGFSLVIVASTDGEEWDMTAGDRKCPTS